MYKFNMLLQSISASESLRQHKHKAHAAPEEKEEEDEERFCSTSVTQYNLITVTICPRDSQIEASMLRNIRKIT